jgi:hypothetical protein
MNSVTRMNALLNNFLASRTIFLNEISVIYAKHNIAMFDVINTVFAAKFKYNLLRPITYIRRELAQPTYNTVIPTLQHPSYPSVASGVTMAAGTIWETLLGTSYAFKDETLSNLYGSFEFSSIQDFIQQAGEQRVSSGVNFRFAVEAGQRIGKKIAEEVNKLPFKVR